MTLMQQHGKRILISSPAFVCLIVSMSLSITFADTHYVWTNSPSPSPPYTNWAGAAQSIQQAIDAASDGDMVLVTNGIYNLSAQIDITNGIVVQSVNGASNTVVDGNYPANNNRCFFLGHSNAVVRGFTVTGGSASDGGGVLCDNGIVEDCRIIGNYATSTAAGIRVADGGIIQNCSIVSNSLVNPMVGLGGGIYFYYGGVVSNCSIEGNSGGGAYMYRGGLMQNSLVSGNSDDLTGGIHIYQGGFIQNCTIVNNSADNAGGVGGVKCAFTGTVENTIIYFNSASNNPNYDNVGSAWKYVYSCLAPYVAGAGNITNDPQLTRSFLLQSSSPCIDAGASSNASPADADGENRWDHPGHNNAISIVDIGADEFVDFDLDQMADYWEIQMFGSTNWNGTGDDDSDGLNDLGEYNNSTDPGNPDTDNDQMPDGWEAGYSLNPLVDDSAGDPDGDGLSNRGEYIAGTVPTNSASVFEITQIASITTNVVFTWPTVSGKFYTVLASSNLMSVWTNVPDPAYTNILGGGSFLSYTNKDFTVVPRYFRVKVRAP